MDLDEYKKPTEYVNISHCPERVAALEGKTFYNFFDQKNSYEKKGWSRNGVNKSNKY
jgi:hypothetical protein